VTIPIPMTVIAAAVAVEMNCNSYESYEVVMNNEIVQTVVRILLFVLFSIHVSLNVNMFH
jgi:hypothetical protein